MDSIASAELHSVLLDQRLPTPVLDGPQVARIVAVSGTTLTFTVPMFSQSVKFGPAPYQPVPGAVPATPPVGSECLVVFAGPGTATPWVVAFKSWP